MSEGSLEKFKNIVIGNASKEGVLFSEWMVDYHLKIVERISLELCDIYKEADKEIVMALVWFHDFGKPLDHDNEREVTRNEGPKVMAECGFPQEFINKTVEYWELLEKKNEIDLSTTPIEVQIISSADGASHFTGVFYPTYFNENGESLESTQKRLREKMETDWNRKIVLSEVREAFKERYIRALEMLGEFPDKFLEK